MVEHFKQRAKRILYTLRRDTNCHLYEFSFDEGEAGQKKSRNILRRLIKKGFVTSKKFSLRGSENKYSVRAMYYLTDEGKKVADEIVKEIDEYKSW